MSSPKCLQCHNSDRTFRIERKSVRPKGVGEATTHNQHLLEQIPVTETERKALAGDQAALKQLIEATPTHGSSTV